MSALYSEMSRLVRQYASNLLTKEAILAAGDDLHHLNLDSDNRRDLGIVYLVLTSLEAEHDLKTFFGAVRNFYVSNIKRMLQKYPFGHTLLKDLGCFSQTKSPLIPLYV